MSIVLNGSSGITTPDIDATSQTSDRFQKNAPALYVRATSNQNTNHNTWTKIETFGSPIVDTTSDWDATNYRFVPSVAGYYRIFARIYGGGLTTGSGSVYWSLSVYKNGVTTEINPYNQAIPNAEKGIELVGEGIYYMNGTTDYLEVWAYQNDSNVRAVGQADFAVSLVSV